MTIGGIGIVGGSARDYNQLGNLPTLVPDHIRLILPLLTNPLFLQNSFAAFLSTSSVFSDYYALNHNVAPFSGGAQAIKPVQSDADDLSPVGQRFWTYTNIAGNNNFILHLASSSSTFNPDASKTYTAFFLVKGSESAVDKKVTAGFFRPNRVEQTTTLDGEWQLIQVTADNNSSAFNLYLHLAGRGADMAADDALSVAALYIYEHP